MRVARVVGWPREAGDDIINGDSGADTIGGGDGDDTLKGNS